MVLVAGARHPSWDVRGMHGLGMDRHSVIQAPRAGTADRRKAHLLAKIVGTLALAAFIISLSAGTAQALDIGEVVEELPVEIGFGVESSSAPEPEPEPEPEQSVTPELTPRATGGLGEVVEDVTEVVTEPASRQPAPTEQAAPQNPVGAIVEPVTRAIEPVADAIEEPVGQVTRSVIEAVEPETDTVQNVVDSAAGAIEEPVTRIVQTVSPVLEEIQQPLQPVLGGVTTSIEETTGLVDDVSTSILDGVDDLVDVTIPVVPSPDDLLGGIDDVSHRAPALDPDPALSGTRPNDPETAISRPDQGPSRSIAGPPHPTVDSPRSPPLPAHQGIVDDRSDSVVAAASPTPSAAGGAADLTIATSEPEPPPYDSESARLKARTGVAATFSSSSSGSTPGLLAVLVLLGLIAPRLSRWLRPRPVLWRPFALAEALELPG